MTTATRRNARWMMLFVAGCLLFVSMSPKTMSQTRFPRPIQTGYTLVDLGVSTNWSFAYAINNSGQTVGEMRKYSGENRAFRTQANQAINPYGSDDLGVLFNNYRSYAYAIDNNGAAVGESVRNNPYVQNRAVRSASPGAALEDLHSFYWTTPMGLSDTSARGINDYGWIVGTYVASGKTHSMVTFGANWTQPIDSWYGNPAQSATLDINNRSQMVGWRTPTVYNPQRAFMYDAAANANRLIDIGMLPGGFTSTANSINEYGQVVGQSDKWVGTQRSTHAFFFHDANNNGLVDAGELRDLDTMNTAYSGAMSVNNGGAAVGYYGEPSVVYGTSRAALFSNNQMQDLNGMVQGGTGGWTLRVATGINDNGQIVGWMEDSNTDQQARVRHAFRLDPPPVQIFTIFP